MTEHSRKKEAQEGDLQEIKNPQSVRRNPFRGRSLVNKVWEMDVGSEFDLRDIL